MFLLLPTVPSLVTPVPTTQSATPITGPEGTPLHIQITPNTPGIFEFLYDYSLLPVSISFVVVPGFTSYHWNFGDGTTSTAPTVTHVFQTGCIYNIVLAASDPGGPTTYGTVVFALFNLKTNSGALLACPHQGTAGITPIEIAGGYLSSYSRYTVNVNGGKLANVTTDQDGDWAVNATQRMPPEVDGTTYNFTTSPSSIKGTFLTLEGVKSTPTSGEPGTAFTLEGRSYPADTTVTIYLGGVRLGQAVSDGQGTFLANLTLPASFRYAGTYLFQTSPPVQGAQATFTIPVSSLTPAPPPLWYWPWILLIPAAIGIIGAYIVWKSRRPVELEVFQAQIKTPLASLWAIRVWANRKITSCTATYDGTPLQALSVAGEPMTESLVDEGGYLDFRIPETLAILDEAYVVVKDGEKTLASEKFGSIEHAKG